MIHNLLEATERPFLRRKTHQGHPAYRCVSDWPPEEDIEQYTDSPPSAAHRPKQRFPCLNKTALGPEETGRPGKCSLGTKQIT
ncbi:hypothetical protein UPYG_G00016270 [Umbra pygmaea]|uniref:Uncharacterized protein n=1 Tax=Umbra pygmaea TaxID=75934 RepID=A0ABD0XME2_UMBPY